MPHNVKILPLDLASGEDLLREAVEKAESFFPDGGIDCMIHNAALERPVSFKLVLLGDHSFVENMFVYIV